MKKNNLIFFLFLIVIGCKSQDFKIIHSSNNEIQSVHYFNSNNEEYAKIYGPTYPKDSLTFTKKGNDLIVNEFTVYKNKKIKSNGNLKYVNYFLSVTDIIPSGSPLHINELPIINFNFIQKDLNIEQIAKDNCTSIKNGYRNCDFTLAKDDELSYFPTNSNINSIVLLKENNSLKKLEIDAVYMDKKFRYQRVYYYENKKIEKIITSMEDHNTKNIYVDTFEIVTN